MTESFDIFISYASEDRAWVKDLYGRLAQCVFEDEDRPPRIFLDKSDLGIGPGLFPEQLTDAVQSSRRLVAVVSRHYFSESKDGWTERELWQAITQDPIGRKGKVVPLFIDQDRTAREKIRRSLLGVQAYDVFDAEPWFPQLTRALGLRPAACERKLSFAADPPDVLVNNTLPPVTVRVPDGAAAQTDRSGLVVELSASIEGLEGTVRRPVRAGAAVFTDLSFKLPGQAVHLTARLTGHAPASTGAFTVRALETAPSPTRAPSVTLRPGASPADARVLFFAGGQALCLVDDEVATVFDRNGAELGRVEGLGDLRVWRSAGRRMALADWQGQLLLLDAEGRATRLDPRRDDSRRPGEFPYTIPGGCSLVEDGVVMGGWNGDIVRVDAQGACTLLLHHDRGVQAIEVQQSALLLCDFAGRFVVYDGQRIVHTASIESHVLHMSRVGRNVVVVTEGKPYQFSFSEGRLIPCDWLRLSRLTCALTMSTRTLVVDQRGDGVVLDEDFHERHRFHVRAGAHAVCAGELGDDSYVSFCYPDGNYALLRNGQIVYTNDTGLLAFDPMLGTVAVGTPDGIRLRSGRDLIAEIERRT